MQFTILACLQDALQEKFDSLNKKCEKYGNPKLSFVVDSIFEEDNQEWAKITVSGCIPMVEKCQLVGVISKLDDGTNSIQNVPGQEIPVEFRTNDFFCDHCKINRYRKEVVIVKNENGEYKQLGKTCLKDYLGIDLENLVNQFTWIYELMEEAKDEENWPREILVVSPQFFVERVAVCIRKLGYTSSKAAWDNPELTPTKSDAWTVCFPNSFSMKFIEKHELYVTQEDIELAKKAIDWAINLEGKNDFEYNTKNVAKQKSVGYKHIGYLAAIVPCYQKFIGVEQEKLAKKDKPESNWVGSEKERLEDTVTCVFTKVIENEFDMYGNGIKTLVKFVTKDGNCLTWFASGEVDFNIGEEYTIKFTVKKHDMYNGDKQTMVNRVKNIKVKV